MNNFQKDAVNFPRTSSEKIRRDIGTLLVIVIIGLAVWYFRHGFPREYDWVDIQVGSPTPAVSGEPLISAIPGERPVLSGTPEVVSGSFYSDRIRDIIVAFECEDNPEADWYCDDPQFMTQAARKWENNTYIWGTGITGAKKDFWWLAKETNGLINTIVIEESGRLGLCSDLRDFPKNVFGERFADCRQK